MKNCKDGCPKLRSADEKKSMYEALDNYYHMNLIGKLQEWMSNTKEFGWREAGGWGVGWLLSHNSHNLIHSSEFPTYSNSLCSISSMILVILRRAHVQSSWLLVEDFIHMFETVADGVHHCRSNSPSIGRRYSSINLVIVPRSCYTEWNHHFDELKVMFQIILKDFIHVSCDSVKES